MFSTIAPAPRGNAPPPPKGQFWSAFFLFSIVAIVAATMFILWEFSRNDSSGFDRWVFLFLIVFLLLVVGLPAGLGGATAWTMVCGRLRQVAWWRAALAGAVSGILSPVYLCVGAWLVSLFFHWGEETLSQPTQPIGEQISGFVVVLLFLMVYTIPVGLVAGFIYRALGNPSAVEKSATG